MQERSAIVNKLSKLKNNQKADQRVKILTKNHKFAHNKFQDVPKTPTQKKIIQSFKKIGKCLNHVNCNDMAVDGYEKICLIIIDNLDTNINEPQETPMNNGYLFGIYLHHFGFRVFYLNDNNQDNYSKFLQFFLIHSTKSLTVYYSDNNNVTNEANKEETKVKESIKNQFNDIIANHSNEKCKIVFVSDCSTSDSVFNIQSANGVNSQEPLEMISFSVNIDSNSCTKENSKSHGNFTYYFCKFIYECPDITPKRLVERMNASINPFGETFICETTQSGLINEPIFEAVQS